MKNATYKVLNYTPNFIAVSTRSHSIGFQPCIGGAPTFEFLSAEDIEYINSQSPIFRTGALEFEEDERDDIYSMLNLPNWKEICLFERDINDLILSSSVDSLRRIVAISDANTIERVRSHMLRLVDNGVVGVSTRVQRVVEQRALEIASGARGTAIAFEETTPVANAEMEDLKNQLAEMRQMLAAQAAKQEPAEPVAPPEVPVPAPVEKPAPAKRQTAKKTPAKANKE